MIKDGKVGFRSDSADPIKIEIFNPAPFSFETIECCHPISATYNLVGFYFYFFVLPRRVFSDCRSLVLSQREKRGGFLYIFLI